MASKAHLNQVIASHLIEIRADEMPDKEIYIFENGEHGEDILTYRILHERSNKIARLFMDKGIGKGDTFAIYMRNHPEFVCGMARGSLWAPLPFPRGSRTTRDSGKFLLTTARPGRSLFPDEDLEAVITDVPTLRFSPSPISRERE